MNRHVTHRQNFPVSTWAGGATTELCIFPAGASCPDRNFAFRVSSATVELAESVFSDFSGYTRHIMPLSGDMALWHNGEPAATLRPYEGHTFDGSWQTRSEGTCVDFNLIHKPELRGELRVVCGSQTGTPVIGVSESVTPVTGGFTGLYVRCDTLIVTGMDAEAPFSYTLHTGDFLLLECGADEHPQALHLQSTQAGVLAVVSTVCMR